MCRVFCLVICHLILTGNTCMMWPVFCIIMTAFACGSCLLLFLLNSLALKNKSVRASLVKPDDTPFGVCGLDTLFLESCNPVWRATDWPNSFQWTFQWISAASDARLLYEYSQENRRLLTDKLSKQRRWLWAGPRSLTSWLIWEKDGFWMCSLSVAMRFRAVLSNTTWYTKHKKVWNKWRGNNKEAARQHVGSQHTVAGFNQEDEGIWAMTQSRNYLRSGIVCRC